MIALASLILCSTSYAWNFHLPNSCALNIMHKQGWRNHLQLSPSDIKGIRLGKRRKITYCSKPLCSIISPSDNPTQNRNTLSLSPPDHIEKLKIGDHLDAFRRKYVRIDGNETSDGQYQEIISNFTIERVSYLPDVFVLRKSVSV